MSRRISSVVERMKAEDFPTPHIWSTATLTEADQTRQIADIIAGRSVTVEPAALPQQRRPRRRVLAGSAIGAAVIAIGIAVVPVIVGSFSPAAAATPPLLSYSAPAVPEDASSVLLDLAEKAGRQSDLPGVGGFEYTKIQGWYLSTSMTMDGTIFEGHIEPSIRETWVGKDGAGRISQSKPDGSAVPSIDGSSGPSINVAAGHNWLYQDLPADPVQLGQALALTHPDYGTFEWFVAVGDVWGVGIPVSPAVQKSLLVFLATKPDMTVLGTVQDRAGREGIAIATDTNTPGHDERHILIFNTTTGALQSYETVALTAGDLPVNAPATVSYTIWVDAARVVAMGDRP